MKNQILSIIALILTGLSAAWADIIYVDCFSPNDPGLGTIEDPYRRIQAGIDAAVGGDSVVIKPGVYTGPGNFDLDPCGKSITICSSDPNNPDVTGQTIIDAGGEGRGFYFHSGEDANCRIWGLTITNAYTGDFGAGICCDNSSPTILNCIITGNLAEGYGSGVCFISSVSQIRNCIISNNRGRYGGGIGCFDSSSITITNCTIAANTVIFSGGGIFCDINADAVIKNSILRANKLDYPQYEYGPQICLFGESSATISYCNIEEGIDGVDSIESTLNWLSGNIQSDPCFASFDANGDPNLWDFHLLSEDGRWYVAFAAVDITQDGFVDLQDFTGLAEVWLQEGEGLAGDLDENGIVDLFDLEIMLKAYLTAQPPQGIWVQDGTSSPCINAGDPESDWSAEPWPNGKRINMGVFGGTNQASKKGLETDFDADGDVDFNDFSYLAANWGLEQTCIEDLDGNGIVDIEDLGEFCVGWLTQE